MTKKQIEELDLGVERLNSYGKVSSYTVVEADGKPTKATIQLDFHGTLWHFSGPSGYSVPGSRGHADGEHYFKDPRAALESLKKWLLEHELDSPR
jgi:hypothetical protein